MKLNLKVFIILATGFLFVSLLFTVSSIITIRDNQNENLSLFKDEFIQENAEQIEISADLFFRFFDKEIESRFGSKLPSATDIVEIVKQIDSSGKRVVIMDSEGQYLVQGSHSPEMLKLLNKAIFERYYSRMILTQERNFTLDNYNTFLADPGLSITPVLAHYRFYKKPGIIIGFGKAFQVGKIRLNIIQKKNSDFFTNYIWTAFYIFIAAVGLTLVITIRFMRRFVLSPLIRLASGFSRISEGELDAQVEVTSNDEIGALTNSFNAMTARLKKLVETLEVRLLEKERMEKELRKARNYIANIINSMPSILIGVDIEGNVTQWNKTAELSTGITANTARGKKLIQVFPLMEPEIKNIIESIKTKQIKQERKRLRRLEKATLYEDITFYPLITNGAEGAVIRIDDVTEKVQMEEQLNHNRKMDAIGQLAGGVAHDFNNILTGIMGAAHLLRLPQRNLDDTGIEYVDMIQQAVRQAADLTTKLLAFGRKGKISTNLIEVHQAIDDIVSILKRTIDKKISISVKKGASDDTVRGDNSAIQNALLNLGINASHAMPGGGVLQIETANIKLSKSYCDASPFEIIPGEYLEIEVRDSGCGIPFEYLQKIFEPFFTTKKQGEGTGLGLAAVYGTVQDHHGAVTVYSEIGTGTVFHIYLPCSAAKVESQKTTEKVISGSGKILLVDDEKIIRVSGKHLLEYIGYKVMLAENGEQAIEIFRKYHKEIDLVIMDMIMPKMNGSEAFYKMKKIDKSCKVVISSGFSKNENLDNLRKSGLAGFIHKPYRISELSEIIDKFLKSKRAPSPGV